MAETAARQAVAAGRARNRAEPRRDDTPAPADAIASFASLGSSHGNRAVSGLLGGGTPLPDDVRAEMESRFGADFGGVRVHDDTRAHASAAALGAKAYTHGHEIVFNANRFAPHAGAGKRLLAHELAHVVQQRRGGAAPVLDANAAHEHAADAAADAVASGQSGVTVAGATGLGVARDEDESWTAKLKRKYREVKDKIPPEYREKMQKAADFAADKAIDTVVLPFGPVAAYEADGLGSSLLHGAQKVVTGQEGAADDLKNFARDKVQVGLGTAKGVATQVTEVVDTALWVGNEYKGLRDKAAEKIGGKDGSIGNTIVKGAIDTTMELLPGTQALPSLADASDQAKHAGLVDPDTKEASLTAPMSDKLNQWAKSAEKKLGATPRDPEMFTPMEKAELVASIGTQVALAFTGEEEVKIALNLVGALSGLRGIVESIRNDKNWKTSSRFWGNVIGLALSVVGLKHTMAAGKITTILLKYGWVAAAVPPLSQMAADYWQLETHPDLPADERKKLEASIKRDWAAAINVLKDAALHVAQSNGGASAKPQAVHDESSGTTVKPTGGAAEQGGAPPPTKTGAVDTAAANPPPPPARVSPEVASKAAAAPLAPPEAVTKTAAPPPVHEEAPPTVVPIGRGKQLPQSAASKALEAKLQQQAPQRAGTVTKLPARRTGGTPPTEPMQQKVPQPLPEQIAVGQTHGPNETQVSAGKPKLSVLPGGREPTVASLKPSGGSVSTETPGTGRTTVASDSEPAKISGGKPLAAAKRARGTSGAAKSPASGDLQPLETAKGAGGSKTGTSKRAIVARGRLEEPSPPVALNAAGGRGTNAEPLVAVRVAGGGAARKGTYVVEGTPEFAKAASDKRFSIMPESQALSLKFRPAGTAFDQTIQPLQIDGVQVESNGAGTGKGSKHNIAARADIQSSQTANEAAFRKTVGASVAEAHGHKVLLQGGELGVLRPGNASTGGVDSITADVGRTKAGGPGKAGPAAQPSEPAPKVFLNDFTGPKTTKAAKATHAKWVLELRDALVHERFGFNNPSYDKAVHDAVQRGEVYVREVRIESTPQGTKVTPLAPRKVRVPASVKADVAKAWRNKP